MTGTLTTGTRGRRGVTGLTSSDKRGPAAPNDPDELLTSAEVASMFGVDRRTVVLWAKRGQLPAVRTPGGQHRFRSRDIEQLLDRAENET
jgi:excisionase family DNA binding protein